MKTKTKYIFPLLMIFLYGCLNSQNVESYKSAVCKEVSVSGIKLNSSKSLKNVIGEKNYQAVKNLYVFDTLDFTNDSMTEVISLTFHTGGSVGEVDEFYVRRQGTVLDSRVRHFDSNNGVNLKKKIVRLEAKNFVTNSGVKLGINSEDLIKVLGKPHKKEKLSNGIKFKYYFEKDKSCKILTEYNMPIYFGYYFFVDNKLTEYKFGFGSP